MTEPERPAILPKPVPADRVALHHAGNAPSEGGVELGGKASVGATAVHA